MNKKNKTDENITLDPIEISGERIESSVNFTTFSESNNNTASRTLQPPTDANQAIASSEMTPVVKGPLYHYETYVLNGKTYKFKEVISDNSGEADIFLVSNNNRDYVFKLYFPDKFPNIELMNIIKSLGNTGFLIQVIDIGIWKDPKSGFSRNFELMEYMKGGTLAEYDLKKDSKTFRSIVMQCAMAIDLCHQNGFLHNDIKPSNFFFKEEQKKTLVLGDFGIAAFYNKETGECRTRQSRTPTFAAPEIYSFVIDNEIIITPKADYFSLGIVLICLWSNITTLVDNERLLVNMKRFGDLPYPDDIPEDQLQLLRGLTVVDPEKRWGFDEISRWFNGEEVEVEKRRLTAMNILYRTKGNWVVNTPEDLAKYMMMDHDLAIKYLYSGRIMRWLIEGEIPELAMGIENIIEKRYPKVQEAGLYAAIYLLDPALPYRDINGQDLSDWKDIVRSLIDNIEEYKTVLTNPDHSLYIYLNSSGQDKLSTEFYNNFLTNGKDTAIWQMIYSLDPELPYYAEYVDSKQNIGYQRCATTDDLIIAAREYKLTDRAWKLISSDSFITWLGHQNNPALYSEVKNFLISTGKKDNAGILSYAIIYMLNRDVSFNLYLPRERNSSLPFIFTPGELGKEINKMIASRYIKGSKENYIESNLNSFKDFYGSRIWSYLYSKGWNDQIDLINTCFDLDSPENRAKNGPYNENIAVYKVIKGLGYTPFYYFKKSKEYIFSPTDLAHINSEERKYELEFGLLKDWLATFYQEDPNAKFTKVYDYEKMTVKYLEMIKSLEKDDPDVKKYTSAKRSINNMSKSLKARYLIYVLTRVIWTVVMLLPLITSLALLLLKADKDFTLHLSPSNFTFIALFSLYVFICNCFVTYLSDLRKSLLVSISLALIIYFLFYFLAEHKPDFIFWTIVGFVSIIIIMICYMVFHTKIHNRSSRHIISSRDFKVNTIEPLQYVFKHTENDKFESSVGPASREFIKQIRSLNRDFILAAIGYTILSFSVSYTIFDLNSYGRENILKREESVMTRIIPMELNPGLSTLSNSPMDEFDKQSNTNKTGKNSQETKLVLSREDILQHLSGYWSGRLNRKDITCSFKDPDQKNIRVVISEVHNSRSIVSIFDGSIDFNTRKIVATSTNIENNIKGDLEGSFNSGYNSFTGEITLPDGKTTKFTLNLEKKSARP